MKARKKVFSNSVKRHKQNARQNLVTAVPEKRGFCFGGFGFFVEKQQKNNKTRRIYLFIALQRF